VRLILDPAVRLYGGGRTLVLGTRIIRLAEGGPAALRALLADTATPAQRRLGEHLVDAGFAHPRPGPKSIDATTVIPVRDRAVNLKGPGPFMLVDDGSRVPVMGPTVVRRERPGGPAAARNTGLEHVESEFVAFLDSDCVPPDDWIERLGGHFDDPRVAAVAPRIKALDGGRSPLDLGPGRRVRYLPSAALIVRRSLARFDPALRYGEDVDLIWRLEKAGWRFRYEPDVVVLHEERDRIKRRFWYGTSAAPLAARHPDKIRHVRLRPWSVATLLLAPRPKWAALVYLAHTALLARTLREKGVPVRLAPVWTANALVQTVAQFARLASPYGAGVAFGHIRSKMRGLPTIEDPSIS
jgi:mycofactocin system glycosyltransferase